MTPANTLQRGDRAMLVLQYEQLRTAIVGNWDGRSSLHGLGTLMRDGMAAWIRRQVEAGRHGSGMPAPQWDSGALPSALCGDVVGVLAAMALVAAGTEVRA